MHIVIRSRPGSVRRTMSFGLSAAIHGLVLAGLALSPPTAHEPRRSLYAMEIAPHEDHIVWYNVRERLPDVRPSEVRGDPRPPRALRLFHQILAAGARDDPRAPQLIFVPAPEIQTPQPPPLPNVLAVAQPARPRRIFTPPAAKPPAVAPPVLPEAPRVSPAAEARSLPLPAPARPLKRFTPPPAARPEPAKTAIPEAPRVTAALRHENLPLDLGKPRVPSRAFTPPPAAPVRPAPVMLADAPAVAGNDPRKVALPVADPRAPLRRFTPPKAAAPATPDPAPLPDAPSVAAPGEARNLPLPDPRAPLRRFTPPPASQPHQAASSADLPAAPSVEHAPAQATLAIAALNPSKAPEFPTPPGSRQAGFSGGPQPRVNGGDGETGDAAIVVPWLTARGGAKDAQPTLAANPDPRAPENLLAAARNTLRNPPADPAMPAAARVSTAPDPFLEGRAVYSIAIQMPNVTSYSGSWIVWFAERQPLPGAPPAEMRAPVPLRKVDPKYVPDAIEERVEGSVRLSAVIRQDGHVESVHLLRHLDSRLDRSAEEALGKWIFEPALRNGTPIDVEAVFEIPFHLAPRVR